MLSAQREGRPEAERGVRWRIEPSGAAALLTDSTAKLLQTGPVTFRGEVAGATGSVVVDVATPPSIVFDMARDGNRDIWRVALDGADMVRLTTHAGDDRMPTAGGGVVVFTSFRHGNAELFSIPATGGTERRLTTTAANETDAALSADGRRLAFIRDVGSLGRVFVSDADAAAPRPLTQGFGFGGSVEGAPSWSPDGSMIAFMATAAGRADLYVAPAEGGTPAPLVVSAAADVEAAWSPDGRFVAFASTRAGDGQTDLYLVAVNSAAVTRLTNGVGTAGQPAWLPDGRIVFTAWDAGTSRIFWLDPDRPGHVHEVPTGQGQPRNPAAIR